MLMILDQLRELREPAKYFPLREVEFSDMVQPTYQQAPMMDVILMVGWERKEFLVMKHRWDPTGEQQGRIVPIHELSTYTAAVVNRIVNYMENE